MAVMNHHRHRFCRPRHHPRGGHVGQAHHVGVGLTHVRAVFRLLAVHGVEQHTFGNAHFARIQKQVFGQDLAACNAGHVGNDTFDLMDAVLVQKLGDGVVHIGGARFGALACL